MLPTLAQLDIIAGAKVDRPNANSVIAALREYGPDYGLDKPHRLAHFLAQIMHESGRFRFDRELWGKTPTKAQAGYETRIDLGNTAAVDGDGYKNRGRGPIQVTGGANIEEFEAWCIGQGMDPPDFTDNPDLINTDPWEGLSAIWYWSTRKLNAYADANNIEQITKRINGGLNGYADRVGIYVRAALVFLGYAPEAVKAFQLTNALQPDGDAGPLTRTALHSALAALAPEVATKSAPVMQEVAVVAKGSEKRAGLWTAALSGIGSVVASVWSALADLPIEIKIVLGVITLLAIGFMLFRGELIIRRVKSLVAEIG